MKKVIVLIMCVCFVCIFSSACSSNEGSDIVGTLNLQGDWVVEKVEVWLDEDGDVGEIGGIMPKGTMISFSGDNNTTDNSGTYGSWKLYKDGPYKKLTMEELSYIFYVGVQDDDNITFVKGDVVVSLKRA